MLARTSISRGTPALLPGSNSLLDALLKEPEGFLDSEISRSRIVVEVHQPMRKLPSVGQSVHNKARLLRESYPSPFSSAEA
jgi:hypothetical protein